MENTKEPKNTVSIELPKGLDGKKVLEILERDSKRQSKQKNYNETRRKVLTTLAKNHKKEYDALWEEFSKKS